MEKKISPLLLVLKILLNENILNSKEETKELHSILEVWLSKVRSPGDLVEVLQRMELVTPNLSFIGLDNMSTVWQLLARCISEWEVLGENKGTQYSFGSVLQFIRYPVQFLGDKDTRFWRDWANLYSALSNQGEVTIGYESGQICSEVTEILITILG
ncbi:uncharacterized protein LOC111708489 isoform X2 [Eurytemora carolleeae]|uniref:uncharacterized protein LOC111708489 isoform X1 n=1 Tax=Eurytemora carolleeae TaxID=1294199 RepID=UPI000C77FC43|nr:uncharacterized protein LOC111708489 isoform X1 [Eurytemora carolleeae]XP_023337656.1 uncharacterized protein LOC111708489 isoform X2 [Eurytemora carolleeae]|eukprot:XP_023337655.1 uncharacterized protein LOC111708489 isoform X1 [Eurytemora affinis]